jgi:parvulin-like peptidyl-prolyl isomerase
MALLINAERIEDDEIQGVREQLEQQASGIEEPEWEAKGVTIDDFAKEMVIAQVLIRQEAARREAVVAPADVDKELQSIREQHGGEQQFLRHLASAKLTDEQVRADVELALRVDKLLDEVCASVTEPTDEELLAYYEENKDLFVAPERLRVSHIVKHVEGGTILDTQAALSDLEPVRKSLANGTDFEGLAMRHSECPENGGDLGYFARGAMVPEFEDVVFAMEVGEVSDIFQTPFGLHIAKVTDRIPEEPQEFEAVKEELCASFAAEGENDAVDAFTDSLKVGAAIEEV